MVPLLPAASATLVADTVGSDFDTVLAVYRGSSLGALTAVACNDDLAPTGDGGGNLRSRVQFGVTAGETYYLRAGGFKGETGNVDAGALTLNLAARRRRRPTTPSPARWSPTRAVHAREPRHAHGGDPDGRDGPDLRRDRQERLVPLRRAG